MKRAILCGFLAMAAFMPVSFADVWLDNHDFDGDKQPDFMAVQFKKPQNTDETFSATVSLNLTTGTSQEINIPVPAWIDSETGQPDSAIHVTLEALPDRVFSNNAQVLKLDFQPEACGVGGGASYFFFANGKLLPGFTTERVSEAGLFHVDDTVDFAPKTLAPDTVQVRITQHTEWDDAKADYTVMNTTIRLYHWDGQALRLLSEEESKSSGN